MCADIPEVYTITAAETTNGTISLSKTTAAAGETITVTATPASLWYELDTIAVSDSNGVVTVNNNSFTMPAGNVTVTVAFKEKDFTNCRGNIIVKFYLNDKSNDISSYVYNEEDQALCGNCPWLTSLPSDVVKYSKIIELELWRNNTASSSGVYIIIDNNTGNITQCTIYKVDSVDLSSNILSIIIKEKSI
jgi:hypothetical protein